MKTYPALKDLPPEPVTGTSRRTLLLNFRSAAAGTVVTYAFNLAVLPFILHRLGAPLYGTWVTIASFLAVGGLADAGVRTEIVRRVGAARGERDDVALERSVHEGISLLLLLVGGVFLLGVVLTAPLRGFVFPHGVSEYSNSEIDWLIRAAFLVLVVTLLGNAYFGVLRGLQRADVETVATMLAAPLGAAATIIGIATGWRLWALFVGLVVERCVAFGWQWSGTRRLVPFLRPRLVKVAGRASRAYLTLSGLALLSQISDVIDSQWDKVVLSHFVGSSAVASFQIGTSLVLQAKALAILPLAPLMVAVAELRSGDRRRMENLEEILMKASMVVGAVVLGAAYVYAPSFIRLWLGGEAAAGSAARLFVLAVAFNLVGAPLALRAFGEGWHRLPAIGSAVNMLVNGTLSLLLTIVIGFNGALYGSILGNLAGTVVFLVLMRRRLGTEWRRPPLAALTVGCATAAIVAASGLGDVNSWASLCTSVALYVALVGSACLAVERLRVRSIMRQPQ